MYGDDLKQEYVEDGVYCDKCKSVYGHGDFPFCKGNPSDHGKMHGFDDAFEPYVDIQILDRKDPRVNSVNKLGIPGVMINSRSERRQLMKELGLQYGTQKFDTKRGKVIYGGSAAVEGQLGGPRGHRRQPKPKFGDPRREE